MKGLVVGTLVLAACSSGRGKERERAEAAPQVRADADSAPEPPSLVDGGTMEIAYEDMPDDSWRQAGEVAMKSWSTSFAARGVKKTTLRPMRAPNGAVARYLLEVKTIAADDSVDFQGAGLVWDGALIQRTGRDGATRWLAGIGFPAERISAGHLVQGLYLCDALPRNWLTPPAVNGWDALTKRDELTGELPVTLEFGKPKKTDALLTLYRIGDASGGGASKPATERLEVRFAADATITIEASRRASGTTTWETFTP